MRQTRKTQERAGSKGGRSQQPSAPGPSAAPRDTRLAGAEVGASRRGRRGRCRGLAFTTEGLGTQNTRDCDKEPSLCGRCQIPQGKNMSPDAGREAHGPLGPFAPGRHACAVYCSKLFK